MSLVHVQRRRWATVAGRQAAALAVPLGILCKVGHAVAMIPDQEAKWQGVCRALCLPHSFRKVQKRI